MKRRIFFVLVIFVQIVFFACASTPKKSDERKITLMNWNAETFFDAEEDGTEYKDFQGAKSKWNREKYVKRLEKLCSVIKMLDCDVVVLEEIEKCGQVKDIKNRLSGTFRKTKYKHTVFAIEKNAPIGCVLMSRFPILNATTHSFCYKNHGKQPSLRPIMRVVLDVKGKEVVIYVNHWKSKADGAQKSEFWRDCQEKLLSSLIQKDVEEGKAVLSCGDFNRCVEEFCYEPKENTNIKLKGGAEVWSPWYTNSGELLPNGSYFYKGNWEKIDNVFVAGGVSVESFAPQLGEWADKNGRPKRYNINSERGYSDHLPIKCKIVF